ncbi:hypothetical protein MIR68_010473 [Amoeboaphelidium protococcarum]|nr:hypothetical protein MIR68_010473 [Amoeboaphelidium protococcarum]
MTVQNTPISSLPLKDYRLSNDSMSQESTMANQVFVIKCQPSVVPIDINMKWLMEQGWDHKLDRMRHSSEQLFIRKFEPLKNFCITVQLLDSLTVVVYSNNQAEAERYFQNLFLFSDDGGSWLNVQESEMNISARGWSDNPSDVMFYCGTVNSAFSIWGKLLIEKQLMSLISLAFAAPFGNDFPESDIEDFALPQTENDDVSMESMPDGYNANLMHKAMRANRKYYDAYQEALSNPDDADLHARAMDAYSQYKKLDPVAMKFDSAWRNAQETIDQKSYKPMPVYPSQRPSWTHGGAMRKHIPGVRGPHQKSSASRSGSMAGARQSMMAF